MKEPMIKDRKPRPSVIAGFTPGHCVNCDKPVSNSKQLFCSEACSQTAALVRYARRKIARGEFDRPDIQEAIEIRLGLIIGSGGYPRMRRRIPPETRAEVYAVAAGKCQKCGRQFGEDFDSQRTIQHLNGSSSDIANLQAWCMRCNKDDVLSKGVPMTDEH
ncbi:MAG: HNH endonuclease, partial [Methylocella sp.]